MNLRVLLSLCILSAGIDLQAQVLTVETIATGGHPFAAMITPDNDYVLCGVRPGEDSHATLEVFHRHNGKFEHAATQALPSDTVQGVALIPGTEEIAIALGEAGIGIVPLADAERGIGKVSVTPVGPGAIAGLLAMSQDGKTMFTGDEYGDGGTVRAFSLQRDATGSVRPTLLGKTLTPRANAGVALSPDAQRVYATAEIVRMDMPPTLDGHGNKDLERHGCMQNPNGRPSANGAVYTIDARNQAVLGKINAGCSPTRIVVSADGKIVYVTARGDDHVLAFGAKALEKNPNAALLRAIASGGASPVGLALFDRDTKLLVANSNRFANGPGSATVIDLNDAKGKVLQTIPTGDFPRNVAVSADGKMLVLIVFGSNQVLILRSK